TLDSTAPATTPKRSSQSSEPVLRRVDPITYRQAPARTNWATIIIGVGIALFLALIVLAVIKKMEQGTGSNQSQTAASPPAPTVEPPPPAPSTSQPEQPSPQPTTSDTLRVKLEATEGDSYVRYQTDDANPVTLTLKQGQTQEIPPAQNQIELVYGNRLALKLTINDREAQFPAGSPKFSGKVVISRETLDSYFQ
ncbi:MAG TPA: hypothetical protein VJQ56_01535, partial [Blastocatellia bacterium]|nr:hypothetical protein [Blastocatellia bacterium]